MSVFDDNYKERAADQLRDAIRSQDSAAIELAINYVIHAAVREAIKSVGAVLREVSLQTDVRSTRETALLCDVVEVIEERLDRGV